MYLLQVRGVRPAGLLQGRPQLRPGGCDHNQQRPRRQAGDEGDHRDHRRVPRATAQGHILPARYQHHC